MKHLKLIAVTVGLILVVNATAGAVTVPLPPNGDMKVDAYGAFSEIFLEVLKDNTVIAPGVVLPKGFYNNVAIGYTQDADGSGTPDFVLYTGASTSVAGPPSGPPNSPPMTILAVGKQAIEDIFQGEGQFEGLTIGRLYVGGTVQSIMTTGDGVDYASDANSDKVQLTFAMYNAYVQSAESDRVGGDD